jgi:hypothetical protein
MEKKATSKSFVPLQASRARTDTPAILAMQGLPYVLPSQPQTGANSFVHASTKSSQMPAPYDVSTSEQ